MKRWKLPETRDGEVCPACGSRNTVELGPRECGADDLLCAACGHVDPSPGTSC